MCKNEHLLEVPARPFYQITICTWVFYFIIYVPRTALLWS